MLHYKTTETVNSHQQPSVISQEEKKYHSNFGNNAFWPQGESYQGVAEI